MKKIPMIALVALIMIIPTITAVFFYFFPITPSINISDDSYGTLGISSEESYYFNEKEHSFLLNYFKGLTENSQPSSIAYDSLSGKRSVSLRTFFDGIRKDIFLYFNLEGESFWADQSKHVYIINEGYADVFFNSEYAKSFYEFSSPPALTISSGAQIIPSYSSWKFVLKNGSFADGINITAPNNNEPYYSTSVSDLSFSKAPTVCTVKAYVGNIKKYDGTLEGLAQAGLEGESLVRYEIEAKWEKGSDSTCFGEVKYSFSINQTTAPIFSIDRTSIVQGEFITVTAHNVTDLSNLYCSVSPVINFSPSFHQNGNDVYALIPFDINLAPGAYTVILRYEKKLQTFRIELSEHQPKIQDEPTLELDEDAINDLNSLIVSIGKAHSDAVYASGTFYNYENDFGDDYNIRLGFGHIRQFGNGTNLRLPGVDFYRPSGENIPALNNGVVHKIGEDAILGKYIVIDHGHGAKSWYCHIGEITVTEGKSVIKGDTVARTGISGLTSSPGFFLMTTIYHIPVSPYNFYENNFVFPN